MSAPEIRLLAEGQLKVTYLESHKTKELSTLADAFGDGTSKGLFELLKSEVTLAHYSASLHFWHSFASAYIKSLCLEDFKPVESCQRENILQKFLEKAPPMVGGERLDATYLRTVWAQLETNLSTRAKTQQRTIGELVEQEFLQWTAVGCLHFHLAETPAEHSTTAPFLFLATFSTKRLNNGRLQHLPLRQALELLKNFHGAHALEKILRPVAKACTYSGTLSKLFENRAILEPCYLSSADAFDLIQAIPAIESEGIIVKLPKNWLEKKPKLAKIEVSIGKMKVSQPSDLGLYLAFRPL